MPGDSGVLVVTRVRSTNAKCTRGCGCSGHPAFPTPSMGREIHARLGRSAPRDRERVSGVEMSTLVKAGHDQFGAALRPALNRLARIRHRGGEAAIDRDRLSIDIGCVVA